MNLTQAQALDAADPLASLRSLFVLPDKLIYLDGNSLGALPRATPVRVAQAVQQEWGEGLISSWNNAGWITLAAHVGDKIAPLIGAHKGEVMVADSTSINLYKVLHSAARIAQPSSPHKRVLLTEAENFPTDSYIAQSVCDQYGYELRSVAADNLLHAIDDAVAIAMLTHVNYRNGRMHDMAALTAAAQAKGALMVWDLAHSAGALPVDLHAVNADFAVGCGYKYLNGGPGAPAFVWVHPRHAARALQPLTGWLGHAAPFTFSPAYVPAQGIQRFVCGTPPILSLTALDCGVDTLHAAIPLGGMSTIRDKSLALTSMFIDLVEQHCAGFELQLITPREAALRGSQVSFTHPQHAYAIMQALISQGVVGDFRAPDILRFGFTPLYTRHEDVWQAVMQLKEVLVSKVYLRASYQQRKTVT
jgi:kynureninase